MAQHQSLGNIAGSLVTGGASAALPTLPAGPSSSSSMSNALPALPPPTVGTAVGIAATAVMATSLMQPGHSSSLTGMATAGMFASSLKNLVLPSGTTLPQQQDSIIKGALGLAAVAAVSAIMNPNKDSSRAEAEAAAAERARDDAKKAADEAAAARRLVEERAFLWGAGNQQRSGQISQAELQAALRDSPTQRDRNKA